MSGHPRFFCENCGAEVKRSADRCPRCGRRFASVRCPKCDFAGNEGLFTDGCPICGYSAAKAEDEGLPRLKLKRTAAGALPFWVYFVTVLAVAAVSIALYFFLR